MSEHYALETHAVRTGIETDRQHGAVVPPLYLSSNYTFQDLAEPRQYDYTRSGNPTRDQLSQALCHLEGGEFGVVTSSGMAAISLVLQSLTPGSVVVAPHDCYGGTFRLLSLLDSRHQIHVEFINQTDPSAIEDVVAQFGERIALFWVETPSNPLLRVTDLRFISSHARKIGATMAVDNTFLSPALQTPIKHGADIVVHSTTKYLNGHSDVVGGAVVCRTARQGEALAQWANCLGITGAPFDAYQTLRGLRTLHARMRCHEENTHRIAEVLAADERIARVYYPGLETDPGHEVAKRQQSGFGGMISFDVDDAQVDLRDFVRSLRLFSLAESLGGVESLVCHPATMTHAPMDEESKIAAGIGNNLVRLSVGIENGDDLVRDITAALRAASRVTTFAATA
ncbi:MAG: cystathionine gamma-synthase [Pseudomonadota bacterium]